MRVTIRAVLLAAALVGSAGPMDSQARTLDAVKSAGALRVAVYRDYKPWSWEENGKLKGIDVDIGAALAQRLGVNVGYLVVRADDNIDDDLRNGVWRGTLLGEPPGDVMLHVPNDARIEAANDRIKLTAPYQVEGLAMAVEPGKAGAAADFSLFESEKIAVDIGTLSDLILLSARDHKLIDKVVHVRGEAKAAEAFDKGEVVAFYGESALVENLASHSSRPVVIIYPKHKLSQSWPVGGAVQAGAVDLADAIDAAIAELASSGELKRILASYGVTWREPKTQ